MLEEVHGLLKTMNKYRSYGQKQYRRIKLGINILLLLLQKITNFEKKIYQE